jgi:hypothetical protein
MKIGLKGKWISSDGGLIFVVGGSIVGTVSKTCNGYHAYGCMTDWQDTNLGPHDNQLSARKAVSDWVKENN